ncbi:hypothetical protein ILUMI_09302 [Ignelater luminosus]|uniref:Farnesyl pyrophosphate synthase n=1 Tax=Ignelater luminosus TaxID=2038154 RepID=A0A8K0D087_IGNLU|nr:hypothetical protein ILUMI_09302 [Ignelater luminosus]
MFTNAVRACSNRTSREIFKNEFKRHISKTSSVPNSECMSSRQQTASPEKIASTKWMKLRKHSNIRALSTVNANAAAPQTLSLVSKDESREFMSIFPDIVRDLTDAGRHTDIPEVTKRFAKVLQYNVPNGKKNRGLAVVAAYKMIESPENRTPENIRLANVLGWCVEMLQASFLINDDIIDAAETRRGVPCWYTNEGVGLQAINDAVMIENGLYSILRKYLSGHHCYVPTLELFNDVILKTSMGQSLDAMSIVDGRPKLDSFTMNRYSAIVKYKTAYYSFQLPVALAMYMAGKYDPEMHRQAKTILLEMGHFFQVQDDFLDCFGNPEVTGKVGTDIRDGKCSWLAVVALQRATPAQRQIMEDHYGRPAPESEAAIRNLYEELGLPNTYSIYEEESFNLIRTHIQQISKGLPHKLFFKFMEKIYKREC